MDREPWESDPGAWRGAAEAPEMLCGWVLLETGLLSWYQRGGDRPRLDLALQFARSTSRFPVIALGEPEMIGHGVNGFVRYAVQVVPPRVAAEGVNQFGSGA